MALTKDTNGSNFVWPKGSIPLACCRSFFHLALRCPLGCCVTANFGIDNDNLFGTTLFDLGAIIQRKGFIFIVWDYEKNLLSN